MEFALVGPHQGKTMALAGFRFRNGVTDVPDDARDARNLLINHYSAYPSHMLEKDGKGVLSVKEGADIVEPLSLAGVVPITGPVAIEEKLEDLSKAELVLMASELKLDATGNKADLIERIGAFKNQK